MSRPKKAAAVEPPVKLPYETDTELVDPIKFLEIFENVNIEGDLLDKLDACHNDPMTFSDAFKDSNLIVCWKLLDTARDPENYPVSGDPMDEKYHKAFINFLKINIVLFKQVPFWRSRMGWFMWMMTCYASPDAYYPLAWEDHFDPRYWYHAGEVPRITHIKGLDPESARDFILD